MSAFIHGSAQPSADLPDVGPCCYGSALDGPQACTCWEPVDRAMFKRIAARCIIDESGHWIWQLSKQKRSGHGQIRINGRTVSTHRAMFMACFGAIDVQVNHRCGVSSCQNPAHLYDGSQVENMQDAKRHGTLYVPEPPSRGVEECRRGHLFDEENTLVITRPNGRVERICRTCHRNRQAGYYQKDPRAALDKQRAYLDAHPEKRARNAARERRREQRIKREAQAS